MISTAIIASIMGINIGQSDLKTIPLETAVKASRPVMFIMSSTVSNKTVIVRYVNSPTLCLPASTLMVDYLQRLGQMEIHDLVSAFKRLAISTTQSKAAVMNMNSFHDMIHLGNANTQRLANATVPASQKIDAVIRTQRETNESIGYLSEEVLRRRITL